MVDTVRKRIHAEAREYLRRIPYASTKAECER